MKDKRVFIKNIYYMLSYAFNCLKIEVFDNTAAEYFDNFQNFLAALLSKCVNKLEKTGLYRDYKVIVDDIPLLKGKIVIPNTINNYINRKRLLSCQYDLFSVNNIYNQIIVTTLKILFKYGDLRNDLKKSIKNNLLCFSNVDDIDPNSISWNCLVFQRNNKLYRLILSLCELVINGLLLTTESGDYALAKFIDSSSVEKLYEKFVLEFYRKEFPCIYVSAAHINWALDSDNTTIEYLPCMKSDVTLMKGKQKLIIDTKFKYHTTQKSEYGNHTLHSSNLYQIFTYVKNESFNTDMEVSGLLLYAATDDAIILDHTYKISGNYISVKTLDLYRNFDDISYDLKSIAINYFNL